MTVFEWQPISGCSPISPGCLNCEVMRRHASKAGNDGLTESGTRGPVWNGRVRFNVNRLSLPRESKQVLVCSQGDLFYEAIPDGWIDRVFAVIRSNPQHVYRALTKRAARMSDYVKTHDPLPANVWLGVSAERQQEVDERLPLLGDTPAIVRYVTLYPLLGKIDLSPFMSWLSCVQVGEEPQRPIDSAWIRKISRDCAAAGVPLVFDDMLGI